MTTSDLEASEFKRTLKEAIAETLQEQRGLLYGIFTEVLEDLALAEAIREGQETGNVGRDEVLKALRGEA